MFRWHWGIGISIFILAIFGDNIFPGTQDIVLQTFSDAYIGVSVFVALTLLLFYGAEYLLEFDVQEFLKDNQKGHVPLAAFLGALPGCGGAIMVITQYAAKRVGFGAIVAALSATKDASSTRTLFASEHERLRIIRRNMPSVIVKQTLLQFP